MKTLDERIIDLEFELAELKALKEEENFTLTLSQKIELARKIIIFNPAGILEEMGYEVRSVEKLGMRRFLKYARVYRFNEDDDIENYWYIADKHGKVVVVTAKNSAKEMALGLLKDKSLEVVENEMERTGWSLYSLYEEYKGY